MQVENEAIAVAWPILDILGSMRCDDLVVNSVRIADLGHENTGAEQGDTHDGVGTIRRHFGLDQRIRYTAKPRR